MILRTTSASISTGWQLEKSPLSRTKVVAVHAGPSLPSLLWRVLTWSVTTKLLPMRTFCSLNKSWSTALAPTETKAATEDGWIKLSITLKTRKSELSQLTPTLPEMDPAKKERENTLLRDTSTFRDVTTSLTPSPRPLSQLLLMLQSGLPTDLVFWATAEPTSTTECCWLEPLTPTGESRTLGEHPGERAASSDSAEETPAPSAAILPTPPYDPINQIITKEYSAVLIVQSSYLKYTNTYILLKELFKNTILINVLS